MLAGLGYAPHDIHQDMTMKEKCSGCPNQQEHQGHLCVLASAGEWEKIKSLTQQPRFICFNCGRVANDRRNLCNPMPLD